MGDDPGSPQFAYWIVLIILFVIHVFLAASEMAIVSSDKGKLQDLAEDGDRRAQRLLTLLGTPSRLITAIHMTMNVIGLGIAALLTVHFSPLVGVWLAAKTGIPYVYNITLVLMLFIISFLMLTFGESIPKRIVLQAPERFAFTANWFLAMLALVTKPFLRCMSGTTNTALRLLGFDATRTEERVTREEIRSIVEVGQEQGVINPHEREMIDSVISFDDKQAEEVMTARTEVFMIDITDPLEHYISEMLSLKYSRIPVYEDNPDNIIGILYLKDFFIQAYKKRSFSDVNIRGILRPAYLIPERKNINDLFCEMQDNQRHMALLIDEYGGFSGLVTMEDLIEEIVGDIDDEYDHDEPDIYPTGENTYHVHGTISIKEFNSEIGSDIDEDSDDFDTIGGFLINMLDYIPEDGERPVVEVDNLIFHILRVEEKRIKDIRVRILPDSHEDEA